MAEHEERGQGPVHEYVDGKGNTWQLTADEAKQLGYKRVARSSDGKMMDLDKVQNKQVSPADVANKK